MQEPAAGLPARRNSPLRMVLAPQKAGPGSPPSGPVPVPQTEPVPLREPKLQTVQMAQRVPVPQQVPGPEHSPDVLAP
jgi:hypothetical protein